jgi:prepilin-type N-terminal cleavage/methylation domain-containing protein
MRRGFTLIEIMVSMALTIFLLTIMAQAFALAADTFRTLKAVGDLNESLRTAANLLRSDLAADHFEGKRRLSDPRFWVDGPPQQGYFFLSSPKAGIVTEGADADGVPSYRNNGATILAFTVKAKGNRPEDFFSIQLAEPAGVKAPVTAVGSPASRFQQPKSFSSQWAEVCYFLVPIPNVTANGTPLFALYRQQRLVVADVDALNWTAPHSKALYATYANKVSCQPSLTLPADLYFNSPADLTIPQRRTACNFQQPSPTGTPAVRIPPATFEPFTNPPMLHFSGAQPNHPATGEDLVLQDVLSFDIKVLLAPGGGFVSLPAPTFFDTWTRRRDDVYPNSVGPMPNPLILNSVQMNFYALQITLRIWHPDAKLARQVSIVVDM